VQISRQIFWGLQYLLSILKDALKRVKSEFNTGYQLVLMSKKILDVHLLLMFRLRQPGATNNNILQPGKKVTWVHFDRFI
jgi:hypothetical protein